MQMLSQVRVVRTTVAAAAMVFGLVGPAAAESMVSFVHVTTSDTISGFLSRLDHPLLNDNPDARVFVTQAWDFAGGQGSQNDRAVGVRYDTDFAGNGRWSIFNQEVQYLMEDGLLFHVVVAGEGTAVFPHLASHDSIQNIASTVQCPPEWDFVCFGAASNLAVGHTLDALGLRGATMPAPYSVLGGPSPVVRAESTDPDYYPNLRPGSLYWILVGSEALGGGRAFTHTATPANTSSWATVLDDPRLDGRSDAVLLVSRSGPSGTTQNEHIGLLYADDGTGEKWSVIHQTTTPVPNGATFTVFLPPIMADGFESGDLSWWD